MKRGLGTWLGGGGGICQAMVSTPEPQKMLPGNKKRMQAVFQVVSPPVSTPVGIKPSKPEGLPPTQKEPCRAPLQVSHIQLYLPPRHTSQNVLEENARDGGGEQPFFVCGGSLGAHSCFVGFLVNSGLHVEVIQNRSLNVAKTQG